MHSSRLHSSHRGLTLTEVLIVVAIISTMMLLGRVAVLLVNNMAQASSVAKVQQEAQLVLYTMTKDVRNSIRIVEASSTTLKLNMLNTMAGFSLSENPNLFNEVNITTLTYTFTTANNETYLRKTLERTNTLVDDKKLLKNLLVPPDSQNPLFIVCNRNGISSSSRCPLPGQTDHPGTNVNHYYGVDIGLRMSPLFVENSDVVYNVKEIRRSKVE